MTRTLDHSVTRSTTNIIIDDIIIENRYIMFLKVTIDNHYDYISLPKSMQSKVRVQCVYESHHNLIHVCKLRFFFHEDYQLLWISYRLMLNKKKVEIFLCRVQIIIYLTTYLTLPTIKH